MNRVIVLSDRELICRHCGFVTLSYEDMVRHLSGTQRYKAENCEILSIKIGQKE